MACLQISYPPLHRLKIKCGAKCSLCGKSQPTVTLYLNGCSVALEQGRYNWRYDSILSTISSILRAYSLAEDTIYADREHLPSTIFPSILVTPLKQTECLCIKTILQLFISLICSMTTNLVAAHSRKRNKEVILRHGKTRLDSGLQNPRDGILGHYQKEMCPLSLDLHQGSTWDLLDHCVKAAISCSYRIFLARK